MRICRSSKGQMYLLGVVLISLILLSSLLFLYMNALSQRKAYYGSIENFVSVVQSVKGDIEKVVAGALATYTSVLETSGNSTFARVRAKEALDEGLKLVYSSFTGYGIELRYESVNCSLADEHQSYREIKKGEVFKAYWYYPDSVSGVSLKFRFNLTRIGLYNYRVSGHGKAYFILKVAILESKPEKLKVSVSREGDIPILDLDEERFEVIYFDNSAGKWKSETPRITRIYSNGTYILKHSIEGPTLNGEVLPLMLRVRDHRGVIVNSFSVSGYNYTVNHKTVGEHAKYEVEVLSDGAWRFLGQTLVVNSGFNYGPIPPIPVRMLRVNSSNGGKVPFQVEDWDSNLVFPLGLSSPHNHFQPFNKLVFILNSSMTNLWIWWVDDVDSELKLVKTDLYYNSNTRWHKNTYYEGKITSTHPVRFTLKRASTANNDLFELGKINFESSAGWGSWTDTVVNNSARNMFVVELEYKGGIDEAPDTYVLVTITFPGYTKYVTFTVKLILNRVTAKKITDFEVLRSFKGYPDFAAQNGTEIVTSHPNGYSKFYNDTVTGGIHHWVARYSETFGTGLMMTLKNLEELYCLDQSGGITVLKSSNHLLLKPVDNVYQPKTTGVTFNANNEVEIYTWSGLLWVYNGGSYMEIEGYSEMVSNPPEITAVQPVS